MGTCPSAPKETLSVTQFSSKSNRLDEGFRNSLFFLIYIIFLSGMHSKS